MSVIEIKAHAEICQLRNILETENMDSSLDSQRKESVDSVKEVYEIWVPRSRLKQLFLGRGVDPQPVIAHYKPESATLVASGKTIKYLLSQIG